MIRWSSIFIVFVAGFAAGFAGKSVADIGMKKSVNRGLLSEAEAWVQAGRRAVAQFRQKEGRLPVAAVELFKTGLLKADDAPYERLRGGARWVGQWDGQGGFLYVSATGQVYLNADISRQKFSRDDWRKIIDGALLPPGVL